jgi:hypothetical protein
MSCIYVQHMYIQLLVTVTVLLKCRSKKNFKKVWWHEATLY